MRHKSTELMGTIKAFVEEYYKNYRHSPSTTEIANAVGIARGTAYKYLLAMSDNGMIRYDGQQISTEQTEKVQTEFTSVALLGAVSCGVPTLEEEYAEEYVSLPVSMFGNGTFFLLRANGESMIDAGISPGDLVLVRKQSEATDRCSKGVRHLFRLKKACKTEAYWKIRICVSEGFSSCFCSALFRFVSVLEGTGKDVAMKKVNRNNGAIDVTTVGGRIKKLRTEMGMSQEELGFALHMEGKSVIYGYESNRRGISGDILVDLAKLLHSTPEYIMNGESPADEDPYIFAVVSLMKGMKTDKRRRIALEHIKIVAEMEE